MKQTVTKNMFINQFRSVRPENFCYDSLVALYDYFIDLEECCDANMELDVISICCDFSEYTIKEALLNYGLDTLEELEEHTSVIKVNDKIIIIQDY